MLEVSGLFGLLLLIAVVYAVVKIAGSRASTAKKVIWIIIVLVFPFLGFIAWLILGPK